MFTPDDLRVLIETEDENNRRGHFTRIFPSYNSRQYLKYFDTIRYYNILVIEWIIKYKSNHDKGLALLNSYCKKQIHTHNPTQSIENQVIDWIQKINKLNETNTFDSSTSGP